MNSSYQRDHFYRCNVVLDCSIAYSRLALSQIKNLWNRKYGEKLQKLLLTFSIVCTCVNNCRTLPKIYHRNKHLENNKTELLHRNYEYNFNHSDEVGAGQSRVNAVQAS